MIDSDINKIHTKYFFNQYYASMEKYKSLSDIASLVGFIAPEIIGCDQNNKSITYKYIRNLNSLRIPYMQHMRYLSKCDNSELFYNVGYVLAGIHKNLKLPCREPWAPCKEFNMAMLKQYGMDYKKVLFDTPQANLHCDYGFSNVNYKEINGNEVLVILDPCPNGFITFNAYAFSSVYIDIANFSVCLDGLIPLNEYVHIDWKKLVALKEAFLSGYEENSGLKIDRYLLACMSYATVHTYFENRYRNRVKTWAARTLVYNSIKQYLSKGQSHAKTSV